MNKLQTEIAEATEDIEVVTDEALCQPGEDLHAVWHHPESDIELKKRIVRVLIREIMVRVDGAVANAVVHWDGGDHTRLVIPRNRTGDHRWKTSEETERVIREVARVWSDRATAAPLNRLGKRTAKGHAWTPSRVATFRNDHGIAVHRDGGLHPPSVSGGPPPSRSEDCQPPRHSHPDCRYVLTLIVARHAPSIWLFTSAATWAGWKFLVLCFRGLWLGDERDRRAADRQRRREQYEDAWYDEAEQQLRDSRHARRAEASRMSRRGFTGPDRAGKFLCGRRGGPPGHSRI